MRFSWCSSVFAAIGLLCPTATEAEHTESLVLGLNTRMENGNRDFYQWQHQCPQGSPLIPETNDRLLSMEKLLTSQKFLQESAQRMSNAVRVNTTSTDRMRFLDISDHAWDHMSVFQQFLETTFHLVHQELEVRSINKHGLLYTWQGTDSALKPIILMAHQDVVPVDMDTEDWTYPPFDGHWDGTYVWGRGSMDCKNTLIASLEAVEELLRAEYTPKRTVILAYGFDEEISGTQGAKEIAKDLLHTYGEKGVAVIIDEGLGIRRSWSGSLAAFPAVAEKGVVNIEVTVSMQTGHSSLPPSDNSITVMADIVSLLNRQKYSISLDEHSPVSQTIFCAAQHDKNMNSLEREAIVLADQGTISLADLVATVVQDHPQAAGFFSTTQSIGVIHGGSKVNVVPGMTKVLINHRVGSQLSQFWGSVHRQAIKPME